jgi:hypothetical protein
MSGAIVSVPQGERERSAPEMNHTGNSRFVAKKCRRMYNDFAIRFPLNPHSYLSSAPSASVLPTDDVAEKQMKASPQSPSWSEIKPSQDFYSTR